MACSVFFTDSAPHFVTWAASRRAATRRHRRGAWWRLRRCRGSRTPPAARTYPRWPCSRRYWPSRSKPPRPAVGGTAAVRLSANRFQSGRVRLHRPARRRRETRTRAGLAALPRRRDCVTCGTPITVTTCNPNRRYCSPRCRAADWHARHPATALLPRRERRCRRRSHPQRRTRRRSGRQRHRPMPALPPRTGHHRRRHPRRRRPRPNTGGDHIALP